MNDTSKIVNSKNKSIFCSKELHCTIDTLNEIYWHNIFARQMTLV